MSSQIPQKATAPPKAAPPEKKKPGIFKRIVSWPKRLSLAAKAALVLFFFLFILAIIVWVLIRSNPEHVSLYHVLTVQRVLTVVVLLIAIPILVYYTLKVWLEGERSRFPEIDFAWNAGIDALEANGLTLDAIPLFLVLGSTDERQEHAIANATGRGFRVRGVPEGPAPLHWYANPDGAYLFCSEIGSLSALAHLVQKKSADVAAFGPTVPETPLPAPEPQPAPSAIRGTLNLDQPISAQETPPATPAIPPSPVLGGLSSSPPGGAPPQLRGTMMFQDPVSELPQPPASSPSPSSAAPRPTATAPGTTEPALLSARDAAEQRRRLRYLGRLLGRSREPLCPLNGMLTLLPFETIEASAAQAAELEKAVRADLATAKRTLKLLCPATAPGVGLEKEKGFSELVRRVGRDRAAAQRFGRGFDVRSLATTEELAAISAHVCGAFEDWVYTLFREKGALTRPGNTRLFGLLCKVRSNLKGRLTEILADGFGYEPDRQSADERNLFSGCYFAATGETEDRQAFVKGVFDKLEEEQEEIEWTSTALADDRRYRRMTTAALIIGAILAVSLIGTIAARTG